MEKYLIIKQSYPYDKYKGTVNQIANFLDAAPNFVKLHIDKEVNLRGWEIKSIKQCQNQTN